MFPEYAGTGGQTIRTRRRLSISDSQPAPGKSATDLHLFRHAELESTLEVFIL